LRAARSSERKDKNAWWQGTRAPRSPHSQSASSFQTLNIVLSITCETTTCSSILCCNVDMTWGKRLPRHVHYKITLTAAWLEVKWVMQQVVFEKQNGPCSWDWQTVASMLQKNCVTRVLHLHAMRLHHCAAWNTQLERTSEINLHEWTTSLQCSVLVTDWTNRNLGKLFKIQIWKMY